ncbi:acyl-CoA dehydrogenase [Ventosimonas gracilis]|uniref:3-methylmercaptopropionyl-CoA dehydrogenase n=1 Tax=Ventosimonas gracilis TaxID=1680762 RepID=A0A139SSN9_9GAMM|nr:acyl-CoA dehydrogenase C-terminal domain-containing protein [Ventosimonas gracilis]KXU37554.1 acyl-CoA dehydrogenase [Ventosimonas gracilis]
MSDYQAPVRDMQFVLDEVFSVDKLWARLPELSELDWDSALAILEAAGKLCAEQIAPINRSGDEQGCSFNAGSVCTPKGFPEAFARFAGGGFCGFCGEAELGGMGMPKTLGVQLEEMLAASNLSFSLYPILSAGAALLLNAHASEAIKQTFLPKLYSGQWCGTMCLTEAQAGSDLGLIRTRAEAKEDGSYKISGSKIFITGGEHDLTENIIHLVLARLPDAAPGSKGISLFLVPKFLVREDGSLAERNQLSCGSIEHKMGIKASATCVMNFDGATGFLIDAPGKGLAAMFTMMNYERLGVGIQGLGAAERSWQNALAYAKERKQGSEAGSQEAVSIIEHADVRRMLLTMKVLIEGGRAFSCYLASQLDLAKYSKDAAERERAEALVALLTPLAKAFLTDIGLEVTVLGQQIFGGHGFIREAGQEQLVRDVRITQIYEGTNGIQALDLAGRKLVSNNGAFYRLFADEIKDFIASAELGLQEFTTPLAKALNSLDELTTWLLKQGKQDRREIGAASVEYLQVFGYVTFAYLWAKMAQVALAKEGDFYLGKLASARFYFARLLPRIHSLAETAKAGSGVLYELNEALF